ALTGATDTGAGLVLSSSSLTFAPQPVGTSSPSQTVTVTSRGDSDLEVLQIDISGINAGDFSQSNNCTLALPVGTSCQINFAFTPSASGTRVASVTIGYNNLQDSPQTITLTGNRISGPGLVIDPLALNFPSSSFNNQTPTLNVTLASAGTAAVSITGITITGADSSRFSQTNTCGSTLPVNDSCQISVTQFPVMFQTVAATLQISDNASGSPQMILLTGPPKPTPLPTLSPSSLTFPAQTQGSGSAAQAVTITSVGQEPLLISGFVFTGANPDEFGVFSTTCPLQNTLQPGDSCQASIWFTPHTVGTRSATFGLSDNSPILNPPIPTTIVTLTGTGTAPALPMASVAPSSVSFPSQFVGTSGLPENVILTNTGSVAITITGIAASPADFGELTTCGTALAASASCSIGVFFDPSASGTRTGTLTITDSAGNSPQTVALSGTGEDFSVTPAAAPTATVKAGQTAVYMLNLTPGGGFSPQVMFTCAGAPVEASCVVSPNPAMLSGLNTTVAVNVATTAKSLVFLRAPKLDPGVLVKYWSLALEFLLAGLILIWNQQRRDKRGSMGLTTVLLLSCALLTISACGGGSSSGPNTGNPNIPGTTAGTYTLTVTATYTTGSSTLSHQTNLTLVVQ
ncbi:MAG: choice-of-anchor D domain-containing protein, partial [Candidatus Acidiferrales bacterium]